MPTDQGYHCAHCAHPHSELPLSFGALAPAFWHDGLANTPGNLLTDDQCVIGGEHFFIRASLLLPILDAGEEFEWGVWISLSDANFARAEELWTDPQRVEEPPYFGWLATELPYTPSTLNLKTNLHTQPVGQRPTVELEPTDHPLAVEQRTGITHDRVRAIAEQLGAPNG